MKLPRSKIICKFSLLLVLILATHPGMAQQLSLRIMSMNIKEGGKPAGFDALAYAGCIREYNPDVVVFQEMDNFTTRNGKKDLLTELAAELGMFPYFGKAFTYATGDFGNAILSKYPFYNARTISSRPAGANEMRACSWIDILLPGKRKVRVGVTHLDVASDEQVRISMLATINTQMLTDNSLPTLLAGDFNATPDSETLNYARFRWQDIGDGTGNTISSTNPTKRIDYVMGYPKSWVRKSYQVVCFPHLSDHCFIVADVEHP
ncbi:MAG: endonuclease/exonuclease/phosphatase family protein [Bacteroidales bacterium]|nr:endonuclease/exonuclease/phosphatase family protein [Bacteroidales bacterium]